MECPMHNDALKKLFLIKNSWKFHFFFFKISCLKIWFLCKSNLRSSCYDFSCQKNVDIININNIIYQITFKSVPLWVGHGLIWMKSLSLPLSRTLMFSSQMHHRNHKLLQPGTWTCCSHAPQLYDSHCGNNPGTETYTTFMFIVRYTRDIQYIHVYS